LIEKVIQEEEESFLRTLETGIKLLEKNIVSPLTPLHEEKGTVLSGKIALSLYDTFGFPFGLDRTYSS